MLSKNQIAAKLEERGVGRKRAIAHMLNELASLAAEEIARGEDFTVPGIARVGYGYTSPLAKGEKHKKGETYVGFGGQEITAEADSKPRKASVKLKVTAAVQIKRIVPTTKDATAMSAFLRSKAGKNVVARKAR